MKTIEERAKEYVPNVIDPNYVELPARGGGFFLMALRDAYIAGAKEQKAIDDAELLKLKSSWERKAYKWIKENTECGIHPQSAYGFADRFIKAMEE